MRNELDKILNPAFEDLHEGELLATFRNGSKAIFPCFSLEMLEKNKKELFSVIRCTEGKAEKIF